MKLLKLDRKEGIIRGVIKSYDDLVVLSYVITPGDRLTAYSRRKITIGKEHVIKTVKIGIDAEKTELTPVGLSVSGKIFFSSDPDIPLHKYHTIYLKLKSGFSLSKSRILDFQASILRRSEQRSPKIFVCVYELGYAIFYRITNYSVKRLYELKENVQGKRFKNETKEKFFDKLEESIENEYKKTKWDVFIVAGKAMDNEELKRGRLKDLDISYETVSYADTGLHELIAKDKINALLKNTKIGMQRRLIKEYLSAISAGSPDYVYGRAKILEALGSKSPVEVLVTRDFVMENLDLMAKLESLGAEIQFFDEKDDSLDQLAGFGGILLKLA